MPYYNVTALADNVTGLDTMVSMTNQMTGGAFGWMFIMAMTIIFFLGFYTRTGDTNRSVSATGFIMFIITLLCWMLNWVAGWIVFVVLLGFAIATAFVFKSR